MHYFLSKLVTVKNKKKFNRQNNDIFYSQLFKRKIYFYEVIKIVNHGWQQNT